MRLSFKARKGQEELVFGSSTSFRKVRDGHPIAISLFQRHYSCRTLKNRRRIVGPGARIVLLTNDNKALFVWREFINDDGNEGINCAAFRNEGLRLSSELILEAEQFAWERWPGRRLYTYVNAKALRNTNYNPGCCFKKAGWQVCGITQENKLLILEKLATSVT